MGFPLHFSHKTVSVTDLERSERFFGETLGLDFVGRDLWPGEPPNSTFKTQIGQYVVLVQVPEVDPSRAEHWNFMTTPEDLIKVRERLRALGCSVGDFRDQYRAIGEMSDNYYDPDNQIMQLTAIAPEAYETPPAGLGKIMAGSIDNFPAGSVTRVPEGRCYIVRTNDGVLAISEVCTHRQGMVQYQPEHYRFFCPIHFNRFDRIGRHLGHTPGTPPLHVYPIEFVDGQIVVDTDVSVARTPDEAKKMVPIHEGVASGH